MVILGISSFYHDSAAAIIKDSKIVCAAEEERFTRIKHDNQFPEKAIDFCFKSFGFSAENLDAIAYYEKPLLKFERIIDSLIETYPFSFPPFVKAIPDWLGNKIKVEKIIRKTTGFKGKIFFVPHHLSHLAATYFTSPFNRAAIFTVDGVGEYQTTGLWRAEDREITPLCSLDFPDSLGLFYSAFTAFLGFRVNNDEYKVMGLASYGQPKYVSKIKKVIDLNSDGSFKLDMNYFSFREDFKMWSKKFENLFGQPRVAGKLIRRRDRDLAASVQEVTEEAYLLSLNHLYKLTGLKNLCLGGGVALNSVANGKIYQNTPFEKVHVFGAAGDGGTASGAALFAYYRLLGGRKRFEVRSADFGSSYSNQEIENALREKGLAYQKVADGKKLLDQTAFFLSKGKIVGWFQGRMEHGPRALGFRSILASPKGKRIKDRVNQVKRREKFRPFAGSILQKYADQYFYVPEKNHYSPFMVFCFKAKAEAKKKMVAIVHVDNTCRIQTVSPENGRYYRLIKQFNKITGIPCLLNTSFNLRTEPIVENPHQAIEDFLKTPMDHLVIGDFIVSKITADKG